MNDWTTDASELADELVAAGKLRSPEWVAALRAVPRHALVPVFYEQDPATGDWLIRDATDPSWHERIYRNQGLFTKIGEATGSWGTGVVGLSSTSTPGLMPRMLEALDIADGHRVLEIGTGTGYNAALLTHRLGEANVFSVDVEPELIDLARERLAAIGLPPPSSPPTAPLGCQSTHRTTASSPPAPSPRSRGPGSTRPARAGWSSPTSSCRCTPGT